MSRQSFFFLHLGGPVVSFMTATLTSDGRQLLGRGALAEALEASRWGLIVLF